MKPLTLTKNESGSFAVTAEGLDSGELAPDEALGVIAHAIYGDGTPHRFLKPQAIPPPELLPCPHCGKKDALVFDKDERTGYTRVICDAGRSHKGCGSASGYKYAQTEALELWNSRAGVVTKIVNVINHASIAEQIGSTEGERIIAETILRNKKQIGDVIDGWIEWKGGECPVPIGTRVDVQYRKGDNSYNQPAGEAGRIGEMWALNWNHTGHSADIVAYRLHVPAQVGIDSEGGSHD